MQKTDFGIEVLIHDDASTDDTADIIREYEKKYPEIIKPVYQTENQWSKGVKISQTYNYPRAQGKYIAYCEGDDYWTDPYKLQKQVDILEQNDQYSFSAHNYKKLENGELNIVNPDMKQEYDIYEIAKRTHFQTASVVIRSEIIKREYVEKSYDDNFLRASHHIFLTAAKYGKLYYFNDVMSVYRVHDGGIYSGKSEVEKIIDIGFPYYKAIFKDFYDNKKLCIIMYKEFVSSVVSLFFLLRCFRVFDYLKEMAPCLNPFEKTFYTIYCILRKSTRYFINLLSGH
jgi:glycosyltransferase involved in cell wall biosynthesis